VAVLLDTTQLYRHSQSVNNARITVLLVQVQRHVLHVLLRVQLVQELHTAHVHRVQSMMELMLSAMSVAQLVLLVQ